MPSKHPLMQCHAQRQATVNKPVLVMPVLTKLRNVSWVMKIHISVTYLVDSLKEKPE